jgi:hypothetical protein
MSAFQLDRRRVLVFFSSRRMRNSPVWHSRTARSLQPVEWQRPKLETPVLSTSLHTTAPFSGVGDNVGAFVVARQLRVVTCFLHWVVPGAFVAVVTAAFVVVVTVTRTFLHTLALCFKQFLSHEPEPKQDLAQ